MQAAADGHVIEHSFEQSFARPELIVNGKPRHTRLLGDGL
jgi:hypothetical protein